MTKQNGKVYLRQNVVAEPLFNQWYAWSHLLSPATAPLFITNLHLKIMQSFVASPAVHVAAAKNPELIGGPFINYDASRVGEIRALMEKTRKEQAHMIRFAEAVKTLDQMLLDEAAGYSLEPLYQKAPPILRGYLELYYDLHNNPSFRLIEGLLYQSPFHNRESQSIALSLINRDQRSFVLSTPRLDDGSSLHLRIPFDSEKVDELFRMKQEPQALDRIAGLLGVPAAERAAFASLCTEEAPPPAARHTGDEIRIRYFSHACLLVESKDVSILIDPLISYKYDSELYRYTFADLPEQIDYVLITHNHQDHCAFETLLQIRHKVKNVIVPRSNGGMVDPSLKLVLRHAGFKHVQEIDEMETLEIAGGAITALPFLGEHADLEIRAKTAYFISVGGRSILAGADSCNIDPQLYTHIHDRVGDLDALFIGMECDGAPLSWLYGPILSKPLPHKMDQSRRFNGSNCQQAADIVMKLRPRRVFIYAMGMEPWLTYITSIQYDDESPPLVESNKLIEDVRNLGIHAERLYCHKEILLPPGNGPSTARAT
jgi:L-ascorbate metabolism protein UlaG (beta-lactamase superfamily)